MPEVINFEIAGYMLLAFRDNRKYVVIRAGRRLGKTYNAFLWILTRLMQNPNSRGLWIDTVQSNLDKYIDRYIFQILGEAKETIKVDRQKHIITFMNGATLDMGSAERPENLEGFGYNYAVLNEAGIILSNEDIWLKTIQPMCKDALVKIIGTPKGINFFYDLSELAKTELDWAEYHYPATGEYRLPTGELIYDPVYLDKLQKSVPESIWNQEYLGLFTSGADENILLTLDQITLALNPNQLPKVIKQNPQILAVDVALKNDKAVWIHHDMAQVIKIYKHDPKKDGKIETPDISRKSFEISRELYIQDYNIIVDSDGLGVGVVGELNQNYDLQVVEFHSNLNVPQDFRYPEFLQSLEFYRFGNIRAQLAFVLRELVINQQFYLLYDQDLINELTQIKFINRKGKFFLESKDEMKKRLGRSPDVADALIYAMYPFLYKLSNGITIALYR
jgi:hypothetical protein